MKIFTFILQLILGCLFLLSGITKAIDPFGGSLKIAEYLSTFNIDIFNEVKLYLSIMLCILEIALALSILLGVYKKITAIIVFIFMLAFTTLTALLVFNPYIAINECGCFGEIIKLTNTQTFIKNITLLILSIAYAISVFKCYQINQKLSYVLCIVIGSSILPIYSAYHLPLVDILPYKVGANVLQGESKLNVYNYDYEDVSKKIFTDNSKPLIIIVSQVPLKSEELSIINHIRGEYGADANYALFSNVDQNVDINKYLVDNVVLKELIRSTSGVVVIKEGVIKAKWNLSKFRVKNINNYIK